MILRLVTALDVGGTGTIEQNDYEEIFYAYESLQNIESKPRKERNPNRYQGFLQKGGQGRATKDMTLGDVNMKGEDEKVDIDW